MYTLVLSVKGREFFYITGNFVPCYIKTLRGMRTRAKQKFVAKATALGARVPRAELFVSAIHPADARRYRKENRTFAGCSAGKTAADGSRPEKGRLQREKRRRGK